MSPQIIKICASFFYIGYIPIAPGSAASLAGLLLCLIFQQSIFLYILFFLVVTILGFWVSGQMEELQEEKDPSCVVIDEVAGCFLAFFMLPSNGAVLITAYFLYRAFDMFKIYPANKLEAMKGSTGIMLDDLSAGLYTNIVMHAALRWIG